MRYINISNDDIPGMIDVAAGYEVDHGCESYDIAYNKVLQWRKNWYALYIEAAEEILRNLVNTNSYLKALPTEKPYVDLKSIAPVSVHRRLCRIGTFGCLMLHFITQA
jgi:hypothetical protein